MSLQFCPNLSTLFTDSPFLDRFKRVRLSGFQAVEFQFPYEFTPDQIKNQITNHNLSVKLFNISSGNPAAGDRGIACLPDRIAEFRQAVRLALTYARTLHCSQLNCLVGTRDERFPLEDQLRVMKENLTFAAEKLEENRVVLLIEHLNKFDVPGFLLSTPDSAFEIQDRLAIPNLKIQFDIYHAQRSQGELAATIQNNLARIAHIQISDNPGRRQPGTGEINFRYLLDFISKIGYQGFIGLEYFSAHNSEETFSWMKEYGL